MRFEPVSTRTLPRFAFGFAVVVLMSVASWVSTVQSRRRRGRYAGPADAGGPQRPDGFGGLPIHARLAARRPSAVLRLPAVSVVATALDEVEEAFAARGARRSRSSSPIPATP